MLFASISLRKLHIEASNFERVISYYVSGKRVTSELIQTVSGDQHRWQFDRYLTYIYICFTLLTEFFIIG